MTITKSITIDCSGTFSRSTSVRNMGGTGIAIAPSSGKMMVLSENAKVGNAAVGVAVLAGGIVRISRAVLLGGFCCRWGRAAESANAGPERSVRETENNQG